MPAVPVTGPLMRLEFPLTAVMGIKLVPLVSVWNAHS